MINEPMFCPKCGNADQLPETYCRQCGTFLPNFDNPTKKLISPQEHLKANTVLSLMTAVVSLTLAILLYATFLGKTNTPILIYVVGGFLIAMCGWQIQTFWRNLLLKKHFKKPAKNTEAESANTDKNQILTTPSRTNKLLDEADFSNFVPPSVVENTTKLLQEVERKNQK